MDGNHLRINRVATPAFHPTMTEAPSEPKPITLLMERSRLVNSSKIEVVIVSAFPSAGSDTWRKMLQTQHCGVADGTMYLA